MKGWVFIEMMLFRWPKKMRLGSPGRKEGRLFLTEETAYAEQVQSHRRVRLHSLLGEEQVFPTG